MGAKSLLRVGYLLMVVQGLLSVFVPKRAIKFATVGWRAGFKNVDDLEPREWYVEVTKIVGVGLLAAGLTGLLVSEAESKSAQDSSGDDSATDDVDFDEEAGDDGPVTVDIEDDE